MSINPFALPEDYPEMLPKIWSVVFVAALAATWLIASLVPSVGEFMRATPLTIKVFDNDVAVAYLVVAIVVSAVFHMVRLHDRVSDLLDVRLRFDVDHILVPLADGVGVSANDDFRLRLRAKRDDLMYGCFYRYASSTKADSAVDKHLIQMALGAWQWFWILAEVDVLVLVCLVVAVAVWNPGWVVALALSLVASAFLFVVIWRRCARYANREVRDILATEDRRSAIRAQLSAV